MSSLPKLQKLDTSSECEGYLHNVGKVTVSKMGNKYFKAQIQEQDTVSELICFATEVQSKMETYEKESYVFNRNYSAIFATLQITLFALGV